MASDESPSNETPQNPATDQLAQLEHWQNRAAELEHDLCLNAFRVEALLQLSRMQGASLHEVTTFALEQGVQVTQSEMGYLAFVDEEETTLTMQAWSQQAMAQCQVIDKPIVYALKDTGLWGEAVRQRRPVITNDYAAPNPHKKGTPHGHVPVRRHMNVPIFDGDRIVAVAGVGNKDLPYNDWDVRELTLLMESMWSIIHRHRYEEELREHRDRLEVLVEKRTAELRTANQQLVDEVRHREQAEAEVRRQHDRIRDYLNIANTILLVIDRDERVSLLNRKGCEVLGYAEGELIGRDWFDCCVPEIHRADRRRVMYRIFHQEAMTEYHEGPVVTRLGQLRLIAWHNAVLRDETGQVTAILSSGEDVTEQRRTQHALEVSEARLRVITDSAPSAIVMVDSHRKVTFWSPAAERIFGYRDDEVLGRDLYGMLTPPESHEAAARRFSDFLHGSLESTLSKVIEIEALHKDGRRLPVEVAVSSLHIDGQWCAVALMSDISQRKRLEAELAESQKLEAIGRLASGLAHEINTPVQYTVNNLRFLEEGFGPLLATAGALRTVIDAARAGTVPGPVLEQAEASLELADPEFLAAEVPQAITQSMTGVDAVATIVSAMREFAGSMTQDKQAADLNQVIQNTLTISHSQWKDVAQVSTHLDSTLPMAPLHRNQFGQVMLQLLQNATQAIVQAGHGPMGHIAVSTQRDGDWVEIRVRDSGCGIPEAIRSKVFEPFFTTRGVGKGTGQGLSLVRSIVVDMHGGSIRFETEVGVGTTFIVRLPLGEPETADDETAREELIAES